MSQSATECKNCAGGDWNFSQVTRLGSYDGMLRTAVLRTKKAGERALAIALTDLLIAGSAQHWMAWKPDVVVPIPMHWSRKAWRGNNCPETMAQRIASRLGVAAGPHVLTRRRRTAPQANLSAARRRSNVRGAFAIGRSIDLDGAKVLLLDDVMTTGATLNEAAKILRLAGAAHVGVGVLARADAAT